MTKPQPLHPKVKAGAQVGVAITAIVALLAAFGIMVPALAVAPIVTLATLVASYFKVA